MLFRIQITIRFLPIYNGSKMTTQNNHMQLINETQTPWFHGNISREKTEKLFKFKLFNFIIFRLLSDRSDGTFLIRNSTNYPGDYTLCVSCNGKVEHYRYKL